MAAKYKNIYPALDLTVLLHDVNVIKSILLIVLEFIMSSYGLL